MTHATEISFLYPDLPEKIRDKHTPTISIFGELEQFALIRFIFVLPAWCPFDKLSKRGHKTNQNWKDSLSDIHT